MNKKICVLLVFLYANTFPMALRVMHLGRQCATKILTNKPNRVKAVATVGALGTGLYWSYKQQQYKDSLAQRPENVQEVVNQAFKENIDTKKWTFNGSDYYGLLGIDEEMLVSHLVSRNKKDIYIMDVGCARGAWAQNIVDILRRKHPDNNTQFHIFSITGGLECDEKSWTEGNITLHQLHQIKIEDIDQELARRGFNVKNKMDVIVSSWTLRHLADPFGTLTKMYGLLNPSQGKLIANGFLFKYEGSDKVKAFPHGSACIASASNASAIFYQCDVCRDVDHFLLERNDKKPLGIPLEYTGNTSSISYRYQCASKKLTEFRLKKDVAQERARDYIDAKEKQYCVAGDNKCQELYAFLKKQGLFEQPVLDEDQTV